ncbi:MAG: 23S rRNA (adenine(2503)-C(2))-methyltransferase RlmN [Candidatus Moranbacteria bacterium]|nr:23S rRNA (adenine(2503)-C(2))-methyltransferase RlmN [Candidatus Moranbacteria bacterium]
MHLVSRTAQVQTFFCDLPAFRFRQIEEALFDVKKRSFSDVSTLPLVVRQKLDEKISWLVVHPAHILESVKKDTFKAIVKLSDDKRVETVLMRNARGQWTVCVSAQVGCAMACTFCATGKMGFSRNLTSDEIVDQYRLWRIFLHDHPEREGRISNIVFMGMGEPLANYDNVKEALRQILTYTDIGPTHITVSTVGLLPMLRTILEDQTWPPVRLAVSLHSADSETRKAMMPSSFDGFLDELAEWTNAYFLVFDSRRRHLTFEYVMLADINDTKEHAEKLIRFARRVGKARINLIPYNFTGSVYRDSSARQFDRFEEMLRSAGVNVTRRRTMGDDIAAACGQLIVVKKNSL